MFDNWYWLLVVYRLLSHRLLSCKPHVSCDRTQDPIPLDKNQDQIFLKTFSQLLEIYQGIKVYKRTFFWRFCILSYGCFWVNVSAWLIWFCQVNNKSLNYVPYVPQVLYVPRARASHVSCSTCSCASRALLPTVLSYPTCLVPHVPRALCAPLFQVPRASCVLYSMWPRALRLCPNITFCALEFPCITLLFFCSFATCDFFWEIYQN